MRRPTALPLTSTSRHGARTDTHESFDQLVKGAQLTISGYCKPDAWVDRQGTKHCRILFVATKISEVAEKEETPAETTKEEGKK